MSEVNEKAASDPGLSDEDQRKDGRRGLRMGPPPSMHAGVSQTKPDPRPKYNFLSLVAIPVSKLTAFVAHSYSIPKVGWSRLNFLLYVRSCGYTENMCI